MSCLFLYRENTTCLKIVFLFISALVFLLSPVFASDSSLFQANEQKFTNIENHTKWLEIIKQENPEYMKRLLRNENNHVLANFSNQSVSETLLKVNHYVNKTTYISDLNLWGEDDRWSSPEEFLERGGDCEDFAIAKYFLLKAAGIPKDSMRLVMVKDTQKDLLHMVLTVAHEGNNYILDNLSNEVLIDTKISHYQPVYSLSETAWWYHKKSLITTASVSKAEKKEAS